MIGSGSISPYFRRGGGISFFLESYPDAAAAYSLRKLNESSVYAIRVRRSSDNSEQDIGFIYDTVRNQYELDAASLLSFCGAFSGYVRTWYDQSGNGNHLIQTTASSQPRIVSSGDLDLSNGEVAMLFDGSDDYLTLTTEISDSRPYSCFQVSQRVSDAAMAPVLSSSVGGAPFAIMEYSDDYYYTRDNNRTVISSSTYNTATQNTLASIQNDTNGYIWKNGDVIPLDAPIGVGGVGNFVDFGRRETVYAGGYCQEFIFFAADKTNDVLPIQYNIADFWNTFMSPNRTSGYNVLIVGQSNGTDRFNQSALPYSSPLANGWTFYKGFDNSTDNGSWQRQNAGVNTMAGGGVAGNFAWSFALAQRSISAFGKAMYVVPTALSSSWLDGSRFGWDPDHVGEYYDRSITNFNQGAAKLSKVDTDIILIIDHGQNDAGDLSTANNYEANLTDWIAAYRTDLSNPTLPVIVISLNSSSIYTYTSTVRAAQLNVIAADANVYGIDGNNYALQDGEHYTDAAAVQLGKDIADLINTL